MRRPDLYLVGVAVFAFLLLVASLLGGGTGPAGFRSIRSMLWSYVFTLVLVALILFPALLPPRTTTE